MVLSGRAAAEGGAIVTFGVAPDRPETGYGYIELGQPFHGAAFAVEKFHEKPDLATAQQMLDAGHYVWNAGIFLFQASAMLAHGKNLRQICWRRFKPPLMERVRTIISGILMMRLGQKLTASQSITLFWKKQTRLLA